MFPTFETRAQKRHCSPSCWTTSQRNCKETASQFFQVVALDDSTLLHIALIGFELPCSQFCTRSSGSICTYHQCIWLFEHTETAWGFATEHGEPLQDCTNYCPLRFRPEKASILAVMNYREGIQGLSKQLAMESGARLNFNVLGLGFLSHDNPLSSIGKVSALVWLALFFCFHPGPPKHKHHLFCHAWQAWHSQGGSVGLFTVAQQTVPWKSMPQDPEQSQLHSTTKKMISLKIQRV